LLDAPKGGKSTAVVVIELYDPSFLKLKMCALFFIKLLTSLTITSTFFVSIKYRKPQQQLTHTLREEMFGEESFAVLPNRKILTFLRKKKLSRIWVKNAKLSSANTFFP